jgi:Archaeal fructose-1,6-bisphosphatase and related enzymes of inositol monophosphatase family
MDLEQFWGDIFSEESARIRAAWQSLEDAERASVHRLLETIVVDAERSQAQRVAAHFALRVVSEAYRATAQQLEDALTFARRLTIEAAQRLRAAFGQLDGRLKDDGSLVTQADVETDHWLSAAIHERYPAHGILSEEQDTVFRGQEWCWVIDPIDGTTNFAQGFPVWGVLVALLHQGQPVLGVAYFPLLGEQYYALRGQGAWLNERPIQPAALRTDPRTGALMIGETRLFACCTRTLRQGRLNLPLKLRVPGTTGYNLALVAKGRAWAAWTRSCMYGTWLRCGRSCSRPAGRCALAYPEARPSRCRGVRTIRRLLSRSSRRAVTQHWPSLSTG